MRLMSQQTRPASSYIWQHAAWPKLTFDALALAQDMQAHDSATHAALVRVFGMARQMLQTRTACHDGFNQAQRLHGVRLDAAAIDVHLGCSGLCRLSHKAAWPARRDLMGPLAKGLLGVKGVGKAMRYAVNVPDGHPPALKP